MTTEIAILNRNAIALAADSAVTIGSKRVWKGMNKLFSLGPTNDIAIMVYNAAEFVGFPWEVIVKTFRAEVNTKFKTVSDCAERFKSFLNDDRFVGDKSNTTAQLSIFVSLLNHIKRQIPKTTKKMVIRRALLDAVQKQMEKYEARAKIIGAPNLKAFTDLYEKDSLSPLIKETLGELSETIKKKIIVLMYEFWTRQIPSPYYSGIVVAGYGTEEFFPCITNLAVDGKDSLILRCWNIRQDVPIAAKSDEKALVVAFGQGDITQLFMEGVGNATKRFISSLIMKVLDDKTDRIIKDFVHDEDEKIVEKAKQKKDNILIGEKFEKELDRFVYKSVSSQILEVVRALPKEELALMARALVEITALRRKVDSTLESVGGPVDVAVISKSDGLVWLERKHYFDIAKNPDFLYRRESVRRLES